MPPPPDRNLLDPSSLPRSLLGVILEHKLDKLTDETFICGTFAQVGWLNISLVVDKHWREKAWHFLPRDPWYRR